MAVLTPTMACAMNAIRASGGLAIPEGGGWWKGADGKRLCYQNPKHPAETASVGTTTIYALVHRDFLRRMNVEPEPWRDTYEVVVP